MGNSRAIRRRVAKGRGLVRRRATQRDLEREKDRRYGYSTLSALKPLRFVEHTQLRNGRVASRRKGDVRNRNIVPAVWPPTCLVRRERLLTPAQRRDRAHDSRHEHNAPGWAIKALRYLKRMRKDLAWAEARDAWDAAEYEWARHQIAGVAGALQGPSAIGG